MLSADANWLLIIAVGSAPTVIVADIPAVDMAQVIIHLLIFLRGKKLSVTCLSTTLEKLVIAEWGGMQVCTYDATAVVKAPLLYGLRSEILLRLLEGLGDPASRETADFIKTSV